MKNMKSQLLKGDESIVTFGWMILIAFTIAGSGMLWLNTSKFITKLRNLNPEYPFPKLSDISVCLIILSIMMAFKVVIESALIHVTEKIMDKKYFEPGQEEIRKTIRRKLASNIFKGSYYGLMSVFGYIVLRECEYFPKELGGKGYMAKMFEEGYPNSFYHEKPKFFNLHYFISLSYSFLDWIWLVFIYDRQSDFWNMVLHHLCTTSLIIFSYITNYSNIGSIVIFLHNVSDVVLYLNRMLIYCQFPPFPKKIIPISIIVSFLYTRLYVFGQVIYTIYYYITWEWEWVTFSLWGFLGFLYIMHGNWSYMILKRFLDVIFFNTYTDSFQFQKKTNENNGTQESNKSQDSDASFKQKAN